MNAPTETLKWTAPPLPTTDEKIPPNEAESIGGLGLNSASILTYKSVLLQDVESIKVPIGVGYASQLLPDLFDMKSLFTASAVGPVNDPKSARSKEKTWAFVGYPDMPPGRAIKGHRPARMLLCINDLDHANLSADEVQAAVQKFYGEDTTAAIYSTSSSRPDDRHWRVVVPLAQAIPTAEWLRLQAGFAEAVAFITGVEVDHSMERATQISWGPNVPTDGRDEDGVPLFFEHRFWGQVMFDPAGVLTPTAVGMLEVVDELAEEARLAEAAAKVERDRKAAEREAARAEAIANGGEGLSAMERFKLEHTTESLLERYGYEQNPRKPVEWRSPMQIASEAERIAKGTNSGVTSYATKLNEDGSWTSMSDTDAKAGIGRRSVGTQFGDAFDLFAYFEHGNSFGKALAAAGAMYGIRPAAQQPSLSEFTAMPAPVLGGFKGLGNPFDRGTSNGVVLSSSGDGKGFTASRSNLELALLNEEFCHRVGFDAFKCETMICEPGNSKWRPLKETDAFNIATCLERRGFKAIARETLRDAIQACADKNTFDSAQDWLNALVWDGVPRVAQFLSKGFGTQDGPYQQAISAYTWTALAGRILHPGTKADMVPIAIGMQGSRKSSAVLAMAPSSEFFAVMDLSLDEADLYRLMRGRLVIEFGELSGLRKKEAEHLKRFVADTHNRWIEKWQTVPTVYARRSIFFGTTNLTSILDDQTGSRRWLPFEAGSCDPDWIASNRDQLYAEGAHLFKANGVAFAAAEKLARAVSVDYATTDSWDDLIGPWAAVHDLAGGKPILILDVLRNSIGLTAGQINRAAEMRAGASLQRLGYIRVQRRLGEGRRGYVYVKQI